MVSPNFGPARLRWLIALAALSVVCVLALGGSIYQGDLKGSGYQFLGRFHPLVVHLPIGVLLLLGGLELTTLRPAWRKLVDPVLSLVQLVALATSVLAFTLGVLLGGAGGYSEELLGGHKRFVLAAVVLQALALVAYAAHCALASERLRHVYRGALGACVVTLGVGAHFGGSLTHGEGYLVRYAPTWLKSVWGETQPEKRPEVSSQPARPTADPLVFKDVVAPILGEYCVSCHGPEKSKAKLRLDSYQALKEGGESGAVLEPGAPEKSTLVKVMNLPEEHDDRMPPEGKPAPTQAERDLIAWWVLRGARPEERVREVLPPSSVIELLKTRITTPAGDDAETESRPASQPPQAPQAAPTAEEATKPESGAEATDALEVEVPEASEAPLAVSASRDEMGGFALLAERCASCHGAKKQKGKLRVDSLAALKRGGKEGAAVVPGRPDASLLLKRVRLPLNDDDHMPPKTKPQLTPREVQVLSDWIRGLGTSASPARAATDSTDEPSVAGASESSAVNGEDPDGGARPDEPASDTSVADAVEVPAIELPALSTVELERLPATVGLYTDVVEPLLHEACGECHIGDPVMGGLSVANYEHLMQSGTVIPGEPARSELLARVLLPETDDDRMPPEGMAPLSPAQVGSLSFWIEQGAESDGQWDRQRLPNAVAHALLGRLSPKVADAASAEQSQAERPLADTQVRHAGCAACAFRADPGSSPLLLSMLLWTSVCLRRRGATRSRSSCHPRMDANQITKH